jgi:protein transport protein SEC31
MVWNPEIPTQFLVANDDPQNPALKIWDLRNPDYPVATYQDLHYDGILSVSWCLSDPNLLVSSGKDFRTVLANSKTGERIFEFPTQQQYNKIVWSSALKGKLACMDTEGSTSVLSLQPEGLFSNPGKTFATP